MDSRIQMFRELALSLCPTLTDEAFEEIAKNASVLEINQDEHILATGKYATKLFFLCNGLMREYFITSEGVEYNKNFVSPGQLTGSLYDIITGSPSLASIQALEYSEVIAIKYKQFMNILESHYCLEKLYRIIVQEILLQKAKREYDLLTMDAIERYQLFQKEHPGLEDKLPQRHIASYLGITPVSLSRLRKAIKDCNDTIIN